MISSVCVSYFFDLYTVSNNELRRSVAAFDLLDDVRVQECTERKPPTHRDRRYPSILLRLQHSSRPMTL